MDPKTIIRWSDTLVQRASGYRWLMLIHNLMCLKCVISSWMLKTLMGQSGTSGTSHITE